MAAARQHSYIININDRNLLKKIVVHYLTVDVRRIRQQQVARNYEDPVMIPGLSHQHDTVLRCTNKDCPFCMPNGRLRLTDYTGQPTKTGTGRLEMWWEDRWEPVAKRDYTDAVAAVACRSMGYEAFKMSYPVAKCDNVDGHNYCGERGPGFTHMQCSGAEKSINECSWQIVHKKFMKTVFTRGLLYILALYCRSCRARTAFGGLSLEILLMFVRKNSECSGKYTLIRILCRRFYGV